MVLMLSVDIQSEIQPCFLASTKMYIRIDDDSLFSAMVKNYDKTAVNDVYHYGHTPIYYH